MAANGESAEQGQRDDASFKDRRRRRAIVEAGAVEPRMRIEITPLADLAPRRIDAERQQRQREAYGPDPEIVVAFPVNAKRWVDDASVGESVMPPSLRRPPRSCASPNESR
jgi:hypothetical protein